eukprot:gene11660-8043_t
MSAAAKKKLKEKLRKERVKERQEAVARLQAKVLGREWCSCVECDYDEIVCGGGITWSAAPTAGEEGRCATADATGDETSMPPDFDVSSLLSSIFGGEKKTTEPEEEEKEEQRQPSAEEEATTVEESQRAEGPSRQGFSSSAASRGRGDEEEEGEGMAYELEPLAPDAARMLRAAAAGSGVSLAPELEEETAAAVSAAAAATPLDPAAAKLVEAGRRYLEEQEEKAKAAAGEKEDDEKVVLPQLGGGAGRRAGKGVARKVPRKATKMSWNMLKLKVLEAYGKAGLEAVQDHDGDAADPLFTVDMKLLHRRSVPVPRHWLKLRSFLSHQADREAAEVVPPSMQLLGVAKIRATRDKEAGLDLAALLRCFFSGTPLQRKSFGMSIPPFLCNTIGDLFHEGKWIAAETLGNPASLQNRNTGVGKGCSCNEGGVMMPEPLSSSLKEALGMSATAPPPWLYEMQSLGRLPPAYPHLRIPGLNAPIPSGAQWGSGQGQWGTPPRAAESNNFLFPGIMDDMRGGGAAATRRSVPRGWGVVPALTAEEIESASEAADHQPANGRTTTSTTASSPTPAAAAAAPSSSASTAPAPGIVPMPFVPKPFPGAAPTVTHTAPSIPAEREYVKILGAPPPSQQQQQHDQQQQQLVYGHTMVSKAAAAAGGMLSTAGSQGYMPPGVVPPEAARYGQQPTPSGAPGGFPYPQPQQHQPQPYNGQQYFNVTTYRMPPPSNAMPNPCINIPEADKTTFQFGELRLGLAAAHAYAGMVVNFIRHYKGLSDGGSRNLYDRVLNAIFTEFMAEESLPHSSQAYQGVLTALSKRQAEVLEKERQRERRKKKVTTTHRIIDLNASTESDEEDELSPEERQKRRQEEEEKSKQAYLEQCRKEEELEEERMRNEAALKARERKVDASAMEQLLQNAEVLNEGGWGKGRKNNKKGGKGGKQSNNMPQEEVNALAETLDRARSEREILQELIAMNVDQLPEALVKLQAEVKQLETEAESKKVANLPPRHAGTMTKGQMAELQGKVKKQTQERNQLLLQLKALEGPELSAALVAAVQRNGELKRELRVEEERRWQREGVFGGGKKTSTIPSYSYPEDRGEGRAARRFETKRGKEKGSEKTIIFINMRHFSALSLLPRVPSRPYFRPCSDLLKYLKNTIKTKDNHPPPPVKSRTTTTGKDGMFIKKTTKKPTLYINTPLFLTPFFEEAFVSPSSTFLRQRREVRDERCLCVCVCHAAVDPLLSLKLMNLFSNLFFSFSLSYIYIG